MLCLQVCSATTELKGPATEYVRYFNFPPEVKASIKSPPLSVLLTHRQQCAANATKEVCHPHTAMPLVCYGEFTSVLLLGRGHILQHAMLAPRAACVPVTRSQAPA